MKWNPLGLLSFFALLGIFGLLTDAKSLIGFLGFIYYIRYFFVTPDEMFIQNIRKAASIGFFLGIVATGLAVAMHTLLPAITAGNVALASCFVVSVFCFTIALVVIELRETRGC